MEKRNRIGWRRLSLTLFVCLIAAFASMAQAQSSSVISKPMPTALAQTVHLDLSNVTVKQAMAELSAQCKIQITAEDYLEDRTLSIHLENMNVEGVLDTITEGNGWVWYVQNETAIRLTRPHIPVPHSPGEVPSALRAALPKDMARFIGYDMSPFDVLPEDRMKSYEKQMKLRSEFRQRVEKSAQGRMPFYLGERLHKVRYEQQKPFEQMLAEDTRNSLKIPYAQLTADQKQSLVGVAVYTAFEKMFRGAGVFYFLHNPIPPASFDPTQTVIGVKGSRIQVGPYINGRIYGYDEGLQPDDPDPLRTDPDRY